MQNGSNDNWSTVTRTSNIDRKSYLRGLLLFNGWVFLSLTKGTPSAHEPVSTHRHLSLRAYCHLEQWQQERFLVRFALYLSHISIWMHPGTDRKWSQLLLTISFLLSLFHSSGEQREIWESGRNGLEGVASFKLWRTERKIWEFFVAALSPLWMTIIGTRNNTLYRMCKTLGAWYTKEMLAL